MKVGTNRGDLLRIANDGTVTDLGLPAGLPAANYDDGSTDLSGNLYIRATSHSLYKIDIAAMTTTTAPLTGVAINGYDSVIIGNNYYPIYGNQLFTVNLTTDVATSATVTGPTNWLNSSNEFGAAWSDQAGELFVSNNGTGSIYQITGYATVAPTANFVVAGTVTSSNDGASCTLATQNPFDPPIANNDSYLTAYNTELNETTIPILENDSGTSLIITSHTNPMHGTVTLDSDGTFNYVPNTNFSGVDSFQYTISDSFGRTSSATVTVTTQAAAVTTRNSPLIKAPSTGYGTYKPLSISSVVERYGLAEIGLVSVGFGFRQLYLSRKRDF
jgi:VCBS repeat-containing protein